MIQPLVRHARWKWRWLRPLGFGFCLTVGALIILISQWGWWSPKTYTPSASITPVGVALGSDGHDARVTMLELEAPYILHIEPEGDGTAAKGSLLYFGSRHSKDPNHPQQAELKRAWEQFKPTVALVEGRMGFFVGLKDQGIGVFGEGAAVYAMAEKAGIPIYTLEPPLEVEIAALKECGDNEQVAMFRVLSGYISARRGGPVSEFKISRLLAKRAAPLTDKFPDAAAFDAYVGSQFPDMGPWRDMPEEAMWPDGDDTLLHKMATRSNKVRDAHFVRTMMDLVNRGERVLAIAGRSHVVVWEPVMWESLQPAHFGELSSPRPWESAGAVTQP